MLTHLDKQGRARMVDISEKPPVRRTASAAGRVHMNARTVTMIRDNLIKKGDVLAVARIAAISGAKRTADLIPLCHNIRLDHVQVDFEVLDDAIAIQSRAVCGDKTGVEMEALTAVSLAALTIYDMCKAVDKTMTVTDIRLVEKTKEKR